MKYVFASFLAILFLTLSLPTASSSFHYMILIDAGSSGSRAHVFEYENSLPTAPLPVIHAVFSQDATPGLSSFANAPIAAGASLQGILDGATRYLKSHHVVLSQVPVKVLATAGMRLLTPTQQEAIYRNVRSYIHSHYAFSLKDEDVRTITGVMEGVYDWLDVNYLQNHFSDASMTVGVIDMGGASTQIAFATQDFLTPENQVVITVNRTRYNVFSQSFLGLGQDQALAAMTGLAGASSCFPEGYSYGSGTGSFNFAACDNLYSGILKDRQVSRHVLPTHGQSFVAFSGIYYTYHFFGILQDPTETALQRQIQSTCQKSWAELESQYKDPFLSRYCANGVYFNALLYQTYHLPGSRLSVSNSIHGTAIDWTLGALLYELLL